MENPPDQGKNIVTFFQADSAEYATYRPNYPDEMIATIVELSEGKNLAIDCATGNGQLAAQLSPHFTQIIGIDQSAAQIQHATKKKNIEYRVESAEDLSAITDNSVDLITVATAIHWLDQAKFFANAQRVLKPGGILAICSISGPTPIKNPQIMNEFSQTHFEPYVPKNFKPLSQIETPPGFVAIKTQAQYVKGSTTTIDNICGYIRTVSAWTILNNQGAGDLILKTLKDRLNQLTSNGNLDVSYEASMKIFKKI